MNNEFVLTQNRIFSRVEQQMIWKKPKSHRTSQEEVRVATEIKSNWLDHEMKISNILLEGDAGSGKTQLAKALSADLQLPYTKITCFADMDKSDVFGALLPVVQTDTEEDSELLEAIYQTDSLAAVLSLIQTHFGIDAFVAKEKFTELIQRIEQNETQEIVHYKFYPSEIVRAIEKGYLLEIQEPTVIRDASVLVALNSALEPNGLLNLPTGIVQRHPDSIVIITTNRNYQGNRPLNESLRDRMQHAERMDLPSLEVMVERAIGKTGLENKAVLLKMAEIIRLLDETAKANAIKGVAGMRSYFYWVNTIKQKQDPIQTIYSKVLYKLTTDVSELEILEKALADAHLLIDLQALLREEKIQERENLNRVAGRKIAQEEADARNIEEEATTVLQGIETLEDKTEEVAEEHHEDVEDVKEQTPTDAQESELPEIATQAVSEENKATKNVKDETTEQMSASEMDAYDQKLKKELNKEVREQLKNTMHQKEGLIVHRPSLEKSDFEQAKQLKAEVVPAVEELSKQILALLDNEEAHGYLQGKYEGQRFNASRIVYNDFKTFDKKLPPHEQPSLAIGVRIDESGSMIRDGRIEAAKKAAIAITEFSKRVNIPLLIYGDTADVSAREKTSLFSYKEFDDSFDFVDEKLTTMRPRQNNRDGVPLRVIAEKLSQQEATTKLLLNISDGQPKALPDYTGKKAKDDIQDVLDMYERKGVVFLAAAIGQDKTEIKEMYGENNYIDISDLQNFPKQVIQLISRYM
ncbi:MAG: AAA family ATPase [Enterococcus sp.]